MPLNRQNNIEFQRSIKGEDKNLTSDNFEERFFISHAHIVFCVFDEVDIKHNLINLHSEWET